MYVTEVVDVRRGAIGTLILHQEVVEPRLELVPLPHDGQLENRLEWCKYDGTTREETIINRHE